MVGARLRDRRSLGLDLLWELKCGITIVLAGLPNGGDIQNLNYAKSEPKIKEK